MSTAKLPRHVHTPDELGQSEFSQTIARDWLPQIDWPRMAAETWAAFVEHMGNLAWTYITKTATDVLNTIASWANMVAAFGNLVWTQVTKTATDVLNTVVNWANVITQFGAWTVGQILGVLTSWTQMTNGSALGNFPIAKLDIPPYKLQTSAYNYVLNPSYEYGTWGGDETISTTTPKFGKQCVRLDAVGANISSGYSNFVDIRGLTYFTVGTWTWTGTLSVGNLELAVWFYKSDKTACTTTHDNFGMITASEGAWTQHTKTYTVSTDVPADCCFIRVKAMWWNGSGNPSGQASIDGWQFNSGDQVPAFQDFTNYSYNWMPEKLETSASSDYAMVNDNWQTILKYENFDCESTMLLLILGHAGSIRCSNDGVDARCYLSIDAPSDDDQTEAGALTETYGYLGNDGHPSDNHYSVHSIAILTKGLHTLRLHGKRYVPTSGNVVFKGRRITIIKGFYAGGTT